MTLRRKQQATPKRTRLVDFNPSGLQYGQFAFVRKDIEVGSEFFAHLVKNEFDPEPVELTFNGERIGWVPKALGGGKTILRNLLSAGVKLRFLVVNINTSASHVDQRLVVAAYLEQ